MNEKVLLIDSRDDMAVALENLKAGSVFTVKGEEIKLLEDVPAKHKFLLKDAPKGMELNMYGVVVGKPKEDLKKGALLTIQNLSHATEPYRDNLEGYNWTAPSIDRLKNATFLGYHRADGSVGTRNFWLVIPLVFCENRNLEILKASLTEELGYGKADKYKLFAKNLVGKIKQGKTFESDHLDAIEMDVLIQERVFPNVDGIKFLTHSMGCGGTRQDSQALCGLLAGYITHPNVAGATVLSLGCQHAQAEILQEEIQKRDSNFSKPLRVFEQQKYPNEEALMEEALKSILVELQNANQLTRKPAPISKLVIGLECGASDGFSGISANPAVGTASDYLVALGGTTILSEFPELAGVENNLLQRSKTPEIAKRFKDLMTVYSKRAEEAGSGFDMNPSPGNIRDGLITDAIKSAGAAKKGGTAPVSDVLDYPEKVKTNGLNLLCTPGNDVESTTALAAAGSNILFFTTGLGTPTGNPVSPTLKISSNNALVEKMNDIIDFNAGGIITGEQSLEEAGWQLLEKALETASGLYYTKSELLGQNDFIPWKRGVSL